jgi:hypothetical protein
MSIRRKTLKFNFRSVETLESRQLLAGHGFGAFAQLASAGTHPAFISSALAGGHGGAREVFFAATSRHFGGGESQGTTLSAALTDPDSTATGTVTYKTYVEDGVTETRLKVKITGAEADSTVAVTINGTEVGQVTTNANGNGTLVLSSDPKDDQSPLPDNFPTDIASGSAVTAGTLSGTLETVARNGHHHSDSTGLSAMLTDAATGATATVAYKASTDEEGETTLKVSVTGADADSTLDVVIGTENVGSITTDANGAGSLTLSSNPGDDEQPLPANFPADVAAGTVVTVGAMSGTLGKTRGNGHGHHGCHGEAGAAFRASLSDETGAAATVNYSSSTRNGTTNTKLSVSVTGAAASSSLDVAIDGTVVGQVATDETGAGSLVLASNPTGTQQQLPANFPTTINASTSVSVGTMTGSFAAAAGKGGLRSFRGR